MEAYALTAAAGDSFGEDEWDTDLADEVEPVIEAIMREISTTVVGQFALGDDAARVLGRIDVSAQVEQFVAKVRGIGPDFARRINETLAQGVGLGEGIPELTARVEGVFAMAERKAAAIARTETNKAANRTITEAAAEVAKEVAITKTWLATDDDRTRDDHLDADGQTVPFDEPFDVGGEQGMYPGDDSFSAAQVVNCRCTLFLDVPDDASDDEAAAAADEEADAEASAGG